MLVRATAYGLRPHREIPIATEVDICSNALQLLGAKPISDFSGADDRTRLVSNLWPQVRDWLLRSHYWNCAVKRVQLAPDVAPPAFDYSQQYTLPGDWLRTLQIGEKGAPVDFTAEGRKILCDDNPLNLVYVARVSEGSWDTALQMAATYAMASLCAYPITQSASLGDSMYGKLVMLLKQTRAIDGQDNPPEQISDFRLFSSRFSSSLPAVLR